jgi:uncharacterized membrane protein
MRYQAVIGALLVTTVGTAAADTAGLQLPLACAGGEPFWGLSIKDERHAIFTWDNQPSPLNVRSFNRAAGRITTWRVVFAGNRQAFIFDEGTQGCSDSDSDLPFAYGILLQNGGGLLRGCCNPVAK